MVPGFFVRQLRIIPKHNSHIFCSISAMTEGDFLCGSCYKENDLLFDFCYDEGSFLSEFCYDEGDFCLVSLSLSVPFPDFAGRRERRTRTMRYAPCLAGGSQPTFLFDSDRLS